MELEANVAVAAIPTLPCSPPTVFPGVTLISEGREAERLGDLPVDVLLESFSSDAEDSARWLEMFDRWGIRNLRALTALPEIPSASAWDSREFVCESWPKARPPQLAAV